MYMCLTLVCISFLFYCDAKERSRSLSPSLFMKTISVAKLCGNQTSSVLVLMVTKILNKNPKSRVDFFRFVVAKTVTIPTCTVW